ncbi:MAG: cellulase family glycosylhydrolase [bacterium]
MSFVTLDRRNLIHNGRAIRLRGFNVGNWLNLENFMIGLPGVDSLIRTAMREIAGDDKCAAFFEAFTDSYFTEDDAAYIAGMGFNLLRVPFNYRLFESDQAPYRYDERGFAHLDRLLGWAKRHGLFVLLDLHAAAGGQSEDWHADNPHVEPLLWSYREFQDRTTALWKVIASRYAHDEALFGYDLLNEPNTADAAALNAFYRRTMAAIRAVDPAHVIVLEGTRWSDDIGSLQPDLFDDPLAMPSFHHYPLFDLPAYPSTRDGVTYDRAYLAETMANKYAFYRALERPMLFGEFGYNAGAPTDAGYRVMDDLLSLIDEQQMHWAHWSYKDVGRMGFMRVAAGTPWQAFRAATAPKNEPLAAPLAALLAAIRTAYPDALPPFQVKMGKKFQLLLDTYALRAQMTALSAATVAEIRAMGASFRLSSCERNEAAWQVLQKHIA